MGSCHGKTTSSPDCCLSLSTAAACSLPGMSSEASPRIACASAAWAPGPLPAGLFRGYAQDQLHLTLQHTDTFCLKRGQTPPWRGRCPSALAALPYSSTMVCNCSHPPGGCHAGSRTCCLRRSQTPPWRGRCPPALGGGRVERAPARLTLSPPMAAPRVCSPTGQMQEMQLWWPPGGQHWS